MSINSIFAALAKWLASNAGVFGRVGSFLDWATIRTWLCDILPAALRNAIVCRTGGRRRPARFRERSSALGQGSCQQAGPRRIRPERSSPATQCDFSRWSFYFDDRFGNWTSFSGVTAPLAPDQPVSRPPQQGRPPGLVSGRPMPPYPFPPPRFGPPDNPSKPGNEDWTWALVRRAEWHKKAR